MAFIAYCDRGGVIGFARKCPDGMLPFFKAETENACRDKVAATARHAYDGDTLLVPGVPEAIDDDHALEALQLHRAWLADEKSDEIDARRKAWIERMAAA